MDDETACNSFIPRTECMAHRQLLEQRIAFVDRRVDTSEQTSNDIKRELSELRKEFTEGFELIKGEFKCEVGRITSASNENHKKTSEKLDLFIESFNSRLMLFLIVAIVMLLSVIMGRSIDFGWLFTK